MYPNMLTKMSRAGIIRESLNRNGALVKVKDMDEACALTNQIAPEHLELAVENPVELISKIKNAGSIFAVNFHQRHWEITVRGRIMSYQLLISTIFIWSKRI